MPKNKVITGTSSLKVKAKKRPGLVKQLSQPFLPSKKKNKADTTPEPPVRLISARSRDDMILMKSFDDMFLPVLKNHNENGVFYSPEQEANGELMEIERNSLQLKIPLREKNPSWDSGYTSPPGGGESCLSPSTPSKGILKKMGSLSPDSRCNSPFVNGNHVSPETTLSPADPGVCSPVRCLSPPPARPMSPEGIADLENALGFLDNVIEEESDQRLSNCKKSVSFGALAEVKNFSNESSENEMDDGFQYYQKLVSFGDVEEIKRKKDSINECSKSVKKNVSFDGVAHKMQEKAALEILEHETGGSCCCEVCMFEVEVKVVDIQPVNDGDPSETCCQELDRFTITVCHHPGCTHLNGNRPLLLCRECDDGIHKKSDYNGHLVLDAPKRKPNNSTLLKFTSAPTLPHSHGGQDSVESQPSLDVDAEDIASDLRGEEHDEGIEEEEEEETAEGPITFRTHSHSLDTDSSIGELQKKLKRKKVVKNKRRHTDGVRSHSVSDIYSRSNGNRSDNDDFDEYHRFSFDAAMADKALTNGADAKRRLSTPSNAFSSQYPHRRSSKTTGRSGPSFMNNSQHSNSALKNMIGQQTNINLENFTLKFSNSGEEEVEIVAAMKSITLREAIQPILERRGMDINVVNVFVEASNTPLPLSCETFLLGGTNMHIREKDGDTDRLPAVGTQSLSKATGAKISGSKGQSAKNSKSGMNRRESVIGRAQSMLEPPINKQRRSSLQLPFQAFFPSPRLGDGSKSIDETGGSLRSRRGINLSIDDTIAMSLTASISPQGTLRENESRKAKPQSKLTNLFSPLNKEREKQDQLSELLNNYSLSGLPSPPSLVQIGQPRIDENMFDVETDWRHLVQNSEKLSKRQHDQQEAIWELLQTELHYIQSLRVITDLFLCVLLNIQNELLLNELETEKLFSNIGEIVNANADFWQEHLVKVILESRQSRGPLNPSIMKEGFRKYQDLFEPYVGYCCRQKTCLDYMKVQYTDNELFKTFVVWAEAQKQCNRLKLTDLLVKPMQRLTKYSLLLQAILRKTDDDIQRKDLLEMIACVDRFVRHVNSTLRQQHEEERLQAIVDKIESYDAVDAPNDECLKLIQPYNSNFNLTAPMPGCDNTQTRALVMQSALKLKEYQSRMDVECMLFTDLLLICKSSKRMDKYKIVKPPMRVDRIIVHELKDKGSFLLVYVNEYHVPVSSFTFHADQMAIRVWVDHIKKAQEMYHEARQENQLGEKPVFPSSEVVQEEVISYTPLILPENPPLLHLTRCSSEENDVRNGPAETGSPINRSRSWTEMEGMNVGVPPVRHNSSESRLENVHGGNPHKSVQYSRSEPVFAAEGSASEDRLQVPQLTVQQAVDASDSDVNLPEFVDDSMKSKLYQRRTSRTEKRYYTADAIQELQKSENKDTSIYKRLSWNFGNGDLSVEKQGVLKHKTMSTDSIRSMHSSSGVSSTGSLHLSPEGDICEEIDELSDKNHVEEYDNEIPMDVNEDDLRDSLFPNSRQSKSRSTSDICTLMQELQTNDIKDGISSVELPRAEDPKKKLSHAQILRMKKQLLLSSNIEASEV